ncbi:hypothetical protein BKG82_27155 [Mycobacteroides chelonae]|uniref:Uncharacterized protein n=1 Tax=Mycobacteroides chelonae TaxID=1774 RepID=A0A1S1LCF1_MYCCH|nr:hypothetical protein [Mycobacteroides chelonae]OHU47333.1 hypothetical protein BKG82_27155 [Mycobacteroides chelonae]
MECDAHAAQDQRSGDDVLRAWLLPTGMPPLIEAPCLGVEGNPGTFIAQTKGHGWGSYPLDRLPADAVLLLPSAKKTAGCFGGMASPAPTSRIQRRTRIGPMTIGTSEPITLQCNGFDSRHENLYQRREIAMGTNYYAIDARAVLPAVGDPGLHIGKKSAGWNFLFRSHPDLDLTSVAKWRAYVAKPGHQVMNEYGEVVDVAEFFAMATSREGRAHTETRWDAGRFHRDHDAADAAFLSVEFC